MANKIDLSTYSGGYWGYINEDVRHTISSVTGKIAVTGDGPPIVSIGADGMQVLGGIAAASTFTALGMINATDDADAAAKGVLVDDLYHTNGTVKIRLV